MAHAETNIVNSIMKDVSPHGARLFRNVRGYFYTIDSVKSLIKATLSLNTMSIKIAIGNLRSVMAGLLAPGASDLVGFMPIIITAEMVGQKIAIFASLEVKTDTGKPTAEQLHFCKIVRESGGFSGVVRSPEEARKILKIIC